MHSVTEWLCKLYHLQN